MVNQASGASRTFVVVDDQSCAYGYYAMAAGAVSHPMATSGMQRTMPDSGPVLMVQEAREPPSGPATTGWVIDASVTMPWFFADEATPYTENLLDAVGATGAVGTHALGARVHKRPAKRATTAPHPHSSPRPKPRQN